MSAAIELAGMTLKRRTQEELTYDLKRLILHSLTNRYRKPKRRTVLNEVSITIEKGEKVGIIGPNGSGKSTLLKVICGILTPSSGRVAVRGRIAPLIELGAGFDPNMSVIDNIVFYGVLLGFPEADMRQRVRFHSSIRRTRRPRNRAAQGTILRDVGTVGFWDRNGRAPGHPVARRGAFRRRSELSHKVEPSYAAVVDGALNDRTRVSRTRIHRECMYPRGVDAGRMRRNGGPRVGSYGELPGLRQRAATVARLGPALGDLHADRIVLAIQC